MYPSRTGFLDPPMLRGYASNVQYYLLSPIDVACRIIESYLHSPMACWFIFKFVYIYSKRRSKY